MEYGTNKKMIATKNNMSYTYFLLGFINVEKKEFEKAIQYLNKAIAWNPISPDNRFEKANVYRKLGQFDRYRVEVEKTYPYIYSSRYMAAYYRHLGWYYTERRIFDLANALYTQSIKFENINLAHEELGYIAKQEKREKRLSTNEEIKRLLTEYNIPQGISYEIIKMFLEVAQLQLKANNIQSVIYVYKALYDITRDKKYLEYIKENEKNQSEQI